jgi:hypothetical protein
MDTRRISIVVVALIGIAYLGTPSSAESNSDATNLTKEFSNDYMRATSLRESGDCSAIAGLVKEIQGKWPQKDNRMYGALIVHALRAWRSACTTGAEEAPIQQIRQYARQALSTYDPNKLDNISIETEFDLVSILHEEYTYSKGKLSEQEWADRRSEGSAMWFHAWQRLENAVDRTWDPNDVPVENVGPPEGVSGFPGMPPELIKDRASRAKYEDAIKKNKEKIRIHNEQLRLRSLKKRYLRIIKKYIGDTYSMPPENKDEVRSLIESSVKDKNARNAFLQAVGKGQPQEP